MFRRLVSGLAGRVAPRLRRPVTGARSFADEALETTAQGRGARTPAAPASAAQGTSRAVTELPAATTERTGSLLLGRFGGRSGGLRSGLSRTGNVIRRSPGGLLGIGAAGVVGASMLDNIQGDPEFQITPTPQLRAEDLRSQRLEDFDAMQQAYTDALSQIASDPRYAETQRAQAQQLSEAMGGWGSARAQGIEEAYSDLAADQAASAAAIERIAGLAEDVFGEDTAATRAAVMSELYGGPATEASGLVPISGAAADMPAQMAGESDISAREALAAILGEASGARFGAETAQRYGQAYADQLRDQIALEQFTAQRQAEANIANEQLRRQQLAEGLQVGLLGSRAALDIETRQAVREEQRLIDQILNAVASDEGMLRAYSQEWSDILEDPRRLALARAQGIVTFEDFVVSQELPWVQQLGGM